MWSVNWAAAAWASCSSRTIRNSANLLVKDRDAITDLKKEVLRGMALMHPGIVRTHHFERDAHTAAIIMEFIEGETLAELKSREPGGCFDCA